MVVSRVVTVCNIVCIKLTRLLLSGKLYGVLGFTCVPVFYFSSPKSLSRSRLERHI
jgi:hypothetical protein